MSILLLKPLPSSHKQVVSRHVPSSSSPFLSSGGWKRESYSEEIEEFTHDPVLPDSTEVVSYLHPRGSELKKVFPDISNRYTSCPFLSKS